MENVECRIKPNESLDTILVRIKEKVDYTPLGEWIQGSGYDQALLKEGRHLNRQDLDKVSEKHPILIQHFTGHFIVANTYALNLAKITRVTSDPEGGKIERDENGEPTGLLIELSAMNLL